MASKRRKAGTSAVRSHEKAYHNSDQETTQEDVQDLYPATDANVAAGGTIAHIVPEVDQYDGTGAIEGKRIGMDINLQQVNWRQEFCWPIWNRSLNKVYSDLRVLAFLLYRTDAGRGTGNDTCTRAPPLYKLFERVGTGGTTFAKASNSGKREERDDFKIIRRWEHRPPSSWYRQRDIILHTPFKGNLTVTRNTDLYTTYVSGVPSGSQQMPYYDFTDAGPDTISQVTQNGGAVNPPKIHGACKITSEHADFHKFNNALIEYDGPGRNNVANAGCWQYVMYALYKLHDPGNLTYSYDIVTTAYPSTDVADHIHVVSAKEYKWFEKT